MKRLLATAAILLTATALLAGCGESADHNAADVTFAKDMVSHHQQAVEMSDIALSTSSNVQVKDLASRIKAAQGPEITNMNGWLASWNETAGGHDMAGMEGMNGMLSDDGMKALGAATGLAFDKLFLESMTAHHKGAVGMAKTELEKGKFEPAKALAGRIVADQERELAEMAQLLGSL